jgi:hypothetical protein
MRKELDDYEAMLEAQSALLLKSWRDLYGAIAADGIDCQAARRSLH